MYIYINSSTGGSGAGGSGWSGCEQNYTSVSSSSCCCCRPLVTFRLCCLRGSKASTTICSVPLISARQKGQPC